MAEDAYQGRDMAILEVVIEIAEQLKCGQAEGFQWPAIYVGRPLWWLD